MDLNQRRFQRVNFKHEAVLYANASDTSADVTLKDISLNGAMVTCPPDWPKTITDVTLLIQLIPCSGESSCEIQIDGVVKHTESGDIGIQFQSMDLESASQLKRLLELNLGDEQELHHQLEELLNHANSNREV